jgi:hypothetical protein
MPHQNLHFSPLINNICCTDECKFGKRPNLHYNWEKSFFLHNKVCPPKGELFKVCLASMGPNTMSHSRRKNIISRSGPLTEHIMKCADNSANTSKEFHRRGAFAGGGGGGGGGAPPLQGPNVWFRDFLACLRQAKEVWDNKKLPPPSHTGHPPTRYRANNLWSFHMGFNLQIFSLCQI